VATVLELASEQNPSEITTAAIAERMRLTQGALFRHFPNKQAIWLAVMEWVSGQLMKRVARAAAQTTGSPLAALEAVFMAHVDFVARHPGIPRMLFGELQHADSTPAKQCVQHMISQYREQISLLLEAGKQAGEVAAEVDVPDAATLFIGTIQGLVMQALLRGSTRRMRSDASGAFAIYRRGIRSGS
jgi:AcrR family transcriptional regulator